MKTRLECLPCLVRHSLNVARMATPDAQAHDRISRETLLHMSKMDFTQPPPILAHWIHLLIRHQVGPGDPYAAVKSESNRLASAILPTWQERVATAKDPRLATVKLAIAANVIDFGVKGELKADDIPTALEDSYAAPLKGDVDALFAAAEAAREILFLADNAGELVFDRLLLALLPREKITVVVKGGPAINDALRADAEAAGLTGWIEVMDNGSDALGTWLDTCSPEFQKRFEGADLIVAKGQANYETLEGCAKDIFFLLKAKCPIVAQNLGHEVGSLVIQRNHP